jgi:CHAT domain-containing protein
MLVGPVVGPEGGTLRSVLVVPDGRLFYLPFETLVPGGAEGGGGGAENGQGRFWAESAEIRYAASVTQGLGRDAEPLRPGEATLLAVGNSRGIGCDNRSPNLRRSFLPLAHVGEEIGTLSRSFPWRNRTILLDRRAGEREVKKALTGGFDAVHIATHGVIDDRLWWRSALLLGPEPDQGEDGFLTALEIAGLGLRSPLVVLSGCETGLGPLYRGEGIQGFSEAFLRAGASDLVVSLWIVDDGATARLMKEFYGRLAAGDPPALALAGAKRAMIGSGLRNPFYWAPFVLIGGNGGAAGPGRSRPGDAT